MRRRALRTQRAACGDSFLATPSPARPPFPEFVALIALMIGVTAFGLFLTPVFYVLLRKLTERRRAQGAPAPQEHADPA